MGGTEAQGELDGMRKGSVGRALSGGISSSSTSRGSDWQSEGVDANGEQGEGEGGEAEGGEGYIKSVMVMIKGMNSLFWMDLNSQV